MIYTISISNSMLNALYGHYCNLIRSKNIVFLVEKQTAYVISQALICCHDTPILDNLDFIYEVIFLRGTFSDDIKRKPPMVFTGALDSASKGTNLEFI
jgi:hypothetical protein